MQKKLLVVIAFCLFCFGALAQTDQTLLSGATTAQVVFPNLGNSCTYSWNASANGTSIGMSSISGNGNIASFTTINKGSTPIVVTIKGSPVSLIPQQVTCTGPNVSFTITVNPVPTISVGQVSGTITTCLGTPSSGQNIQQLSFAGYDLSSDITITAPTGFEISLSANSGYGNLLTVANSSAGVKLYARAAASASPGAIIGNILLTSPGAPSQSVAVAAYVVSPANVNSVANQTITSGNATAAINFAGTADAYIWKNSNPNIGLPATGSGNIASFTPVNTGSSPITATISVTPKAANFAYIANSTSGTVSVINTATRTVIADVPIARAVAVAINADATRAYIVSPPTAKFTTGDVNVIDVRSNKVVPSDVSLSSSFPSTVAASPVSNNDIYVASMGGCVYSADGNRIYETNGSNSVNVINSATKALVANIPVGKNPYGVTASKDGTRVYVANMEGTVSVINTATNKVIATISVGSNPQWLTLSPDGTVLYVTNQLSNSVTVINTATYAIITNINVGTYPSGIAITSDGSEVYVVNSGSNNVSVINTATNTVVATIAVGSGPYSIGNFIADGSYCGTGSPISFTITVNPTIQISSFSPTAAKSGTAVTLTGVNFTGATSVTFGGIPVASFTVNSDTNITAVLGSGASGNIVVTTANGTGTIAGFTFLPPPTISSINPVSASAGTAVNITGVNFAGATNVSFGGVAASSFAVNSATSITATVGAGASGNIVVTTVNGIGTLPGFTYLPPNIISTSIPAIPGSIYGTVSSSASFNVSGNGMLAGILITSPTGFEVSKDNITFTSAVTVGAAGNIAVTPVYIRLSASALVGTNTGQVSLTSQGATTLLSPVTGTVIFALPATNFKVTNISAVCKGTANGSISITAQQSLSYIATITNSAGNSTNYPFTTVATINNLPAGTYNVCITITGQTGYQQCFTSVITEPKDLAVYSAILPQTNQAVLSLSGGDTYHINVNGITTTTTAAQVTLNLKTGTNLIAVSTDKDCQGIITKTIVIADGITLFPNPFTSAVSLNLGNDVIKNATIRIYDTFSRMVYNNQFIGQSGIVKLDLSKLMPGVYVLEWLAGDVQTTHKIIKNK